MKTTRLVRVLAIVGALALAAMSVTCVLAMLAVWHGFRARDQPSMLEQTAASVLRALAIPRRSKQLTNPVHASELVMMEARAHFADHCAQCHANDGSGDTTMGRSLYPKAPDMRRPSTQGKTDGELYYIIENGVRLTGMPAWSESEGDDHEDSWKLVLFIRRLPTLRDEDLAAMEYLNPKSPEEWQAQKDETDFLEGRELAPPRPAMHSHH